MDLEIDGEKRQYEERANKRAVQRQLLLFSGIFLLGSIGCGVAALFLNSWLLGSPFPGLTIRFGLWQNCNNGLLSLLIRKILRPLEKAITKDNSNKLLLIGSEACCNWEDIPGPVWTFIFGIEPDYLYTSRYCFFGFIASSSLSFIMLIVAWFRRWVALGLICVVIPYFVSFLCLTAGFAMGVITFHTVETNLESLTVVGSALSNLFLGHSMYIAGSGVALSFIGSILVFLAQLLWRTILEEDTTNKETEFWLNQPTLDPVTTVLPRVGQHMMPVGGAYGTQLAGPPQMAGYQVDPIYGPPPPAPPPAGPPGSYPAHQRPLPPPHLRK
eukprot:Platyproteum_vivax@DN4400_c0_g1_i1.p1